MTDQKITTLGDAKGPLFWGIDVGGTNIKIGLVDDCGSTLAFDKIRTNEADGPDVAMRRMVEAAGDITEKLGIDPTRVSRVGLGTPGSMDLPKGTLVTPPNLPNWWHFPIRDFVGDLMKLPVSFVNDANAAAYGEYWIGAGQQHDSMIMLTLGTGVGGGVIVHGELVNGVNSFGSECGHAIVDSRPDARLCVWGGGRGQLEAYASASAVVARTRDRLVAGEQSALSGLLGGADSELTALRIYQAASEGDGLAIDIIDETASWLGIGITTFIHLLDPGLVVLGGAMDFGGGDDPIGQRFLNRTAEAFKRRTEQHVFEGTQLMFATLGGDAGYLGAAGFARHQHHRAPQMR
ncbi:MAG: ROK family protein [Planctomycetota bacterium]